VPARIACVFFSLLLAITPLRAGGDDYCFPRDTKAKKHTYCEVVLIRNATAPFHGSGYTVSFESKFFKGLKRSKTRRGIEFRKGKAVVTNYPDTFVLAIEPPFFSPEDDRPVLGGAVSAPTDRIPRRVVLRWLDPNGKTLEERSFALEEVVEWWPELRRSKTWYRTTLNGVNQLLTAEVQVMIFGNSDTLLSTIRGVL
jgi:hypothetical protein